MSETVKRFTVEDCSHCDDSPPIEEDAEGRFVLASDYLALEERAKLNLDSYELQRKLYQDMNGIALEFKAQRDMAIARVGELEATEAAYAAVLERCRTTPGRCFCGVHLSETMEVRNE